jgi:hypothetical protein
MMHQKTWIGLMCLLPLWVQADSLLAADALRQLMNRQDAVSSHAADAKKPKATEPHSDRKTETLKPNETLEGLIKRTWPGLPSKEIWVRKSFVDLNAKAFVQGNPNLIQPGATVTIPSREDLRASFSVSHPQIAALFDAPSADSKPDAEPSSVAAPKWVRFP